MKGELKDEETQKQKRRENRSYGVDNVDDTGNGGRRRGDNRKTVAESKNIKKEGKGMTNVRKEHQ